jgi:signal transduction histidine kinase
MLALGYLALRPALGVCDDAPAGPAMATLTAVAVRTSLVIRCLALGYIVIQVAIWHSFYAADPLRLAGPAAAALCAAAVAGYLRWRTPGWRLAGIDSAAQVALALGATWCVPPAMRGDTANWLYISMVSQLVVPAWFAPAGVLGPLALASGVAYWAGAVWPTGAGSAGNSPAAAAAFLLTVAAASWAGLRMIYRRATAADGALAQADTDARAQYVALLRNTERREHERLLHDTVLNTLTALARPAEPGRNGGSAVPVRAQARRDVTLMEDALTEAGDLDGRARGTGGGLLTGIESVAAEMRRRGLAVHVEAEGRALAGAGSVGAPLGQDEPLVVPEAVATALAHAVREALANVARHAGTGEAWVAVHQLTGPGGAEHGSVQVTVRDEGAGFDPACVDPTRLGLQRSIIERVADWGGQASVRSGPGEGTVVSLRWTAPAVSGQGQPW